MNVHVNPTDMNFNTRDGDPPFANSLGELAEGLTVTAELADGDYLTDDELAEASFEDLPEQEVAEEAPDGTVGAPAPTEADAGGADTGETKPSLPSYEELPLSLREDIQSNAVPEHKDALRDHAHDCAQRLFEKGFSENDVRVIFRTHAGSWKQLFYQNDRALVQDVKRLHGKHPEWVAKEERKKAAKAERAKKKAAVRVTPDAAAPAMTVKELEAIADVGKEYPLPESETLDLHYGIARSGAVMLFETTETKGKNGDTRRISAPVCSPFCVPYRLSYVGESDKVVGLRVTIQDRDGNPCNVDLRSRDLFAQRGTKVLEALADAGLRVEANGERVVSGVLKAINPAAELRIVSNPGWHNAEDGSLVFIAPSGEAFGDKTPFELASETRFKPENSRAGSYDEWKECARIAATVERAEHWRLALMAGFAGVLVSLLGLDTCGIVLVGRHSLGKTLAQQIAAAIFSTPSKSRDGLVQQIKSVGTNGLELLAKRATGTTLVLDELKNTPAKDLESLIFMLAGGSGSARMERTGDKLRPRNRWSTFAIFSNEVSVVEKLKADGLSMTPGAAVRFLSIPISDVNGAVPNEVRTKIGGIQQHYGHAGPAFVQHLISSGLCDDLEALRNRIAQAKVAISGGDNGALERAAEPLAIVQVAAEIAVEAGILPEEVRVSETIAWAWERFLESEEKAQLNPAESAFDSIRRWIAERWGSDICQVGTHSAHRHTLAWYDHDTIYMTRDRLREAAKSGMSVNDVARALRDAGFLTKTKDKDKLFNTYVRGMANDPRLPKGTHVFCLSREEFGSLTEPRGFSLGTSS